MAKNADKGGVFIQNILVLNERFYIVRSGDKHFVRKSPKSAKEVLEEEQNEGDIKANH